jgi:hypothetical protein
LVLDEVRWNAARYKRCNCLQAGQNAAFSQIHVKQQVIKGCERGSLSVINATSFASCPQPSVYIALYNVKECYSCLIPSFIGGFTLEANTQKNDSKTRSMKNTL